MSVEINIHTKGCKINKREKRSESTNMSEEKLIEIQAEAYYRAMKRIEEEKKGTDVLEKKKYTVIENIQYIFYILFCPKIANKKFKLKRAYDSLLVIIISMAFLCVGYLLRLAGLVCIVNSVFQFVKNGSISIQLQVGGIGLLSLLYGSVFVIAGDEFGKEKDSSRIYGYSASIIAIVSCIVSIIAIFVSK